MKRIYTIGWWAVQYMMVVLETWCLLALASGGR